MAFRGSTFRKGAREGKDLIGPLDATGLLLIDVQNWCKPGFKGGGFEKVRRSFVHRLANPELLLVSVLEEGCVLHRQAAVYV